MQRDGRRYSREEEFRTCYAIGWHTKFPRNSVCHLDWPDGKVTPSQAVPSWNQFGTDLEEVSCLFCLDIQSKITSAKTSAPKISCFCTAKLVKIQGKCHDKVLHGDPF